MHSDYDLRILFSTSFSDSCFQAGRALAQLADSCRVSVTMVHVVRYGGSTSRVHRELGSFLAEADHYDDCRRVLIESDDAPLAIADFTARDRFDLVISPASDRLGLHSALVPSFRGRLLERAAAPLWTIGHSVPAGRFQRGIRNVGCLVDFDGDPDVQLPRAAAFAGHFGAQLHLFDVIAPVSEGTVLNAMQSDRPLSPELSVARLRRLVADASRPAVHAAVGHRGRELPRMLDRGDVDVLFVSQAQAARGFLLPRYARDLDRLPCPVICLSGDGTAPQWSFERALSRDSEVREALDELVMAS